MEAPARVALQTFHQPTNQPTRDEQRRRLTTGTGTGGPESRLAARGGSGAYKVVIKGTDCRCIDGKY